MCHVQVRMLYIYMSDYINLQFFCPGLVEIFAKCTKTKIETLNVHVYLTNGWCEFAVWSIGQPLKYCLLKYFGYMVQYKNGVHWRTGHI